MKWLKQFPIRHAKGLYSIAFAIIITIYILGLLYELRNPGLMCLTKKYIPQDFLNRINTNISGSNDLLTLSVALTIEAICSAIVIFLYGRFSEKNYGLTAKEFITDTMGWTFMLFRVIVMFTPFIQLTCISLKWHYVSFANVISGCLVITLFILLAFTIMQKENVLYFIEIKLEKEKKELKKIYDPIIKEELAGGYLTNNEKGEKYRNSKYQIEESLDTKVLGIINNCSEKHAVYEIINKFYDQIIDSDDHTAIDFIYMFDLTSYLLMQPYDSTHMWEIMILDDKMLKLNKKVSQANETKYDVLFIGIIYAVISSGNEMAKKYLLNDFFDISLHTNDDIKKRLLTATAQFIELMIQIGRCDDAYFIEMLYRLDRSAYPYLFEDSIGISDYSFMLSMRRFGTLDGIRMCFTRTKEDLQKMNDEDHIPRTTVGILLERKGLNKNDRKDLIFRK